MAKAKKNGKKKKPAPAARKVKSRKQAVLPGMEERSIPKLDKAAEKYCNARDARMRLTIAEKAAKDDLLGEMHAQNKKAYIHGEVEITITPEGEKLKVRIHKDVEPDDEEDQNEETGEETVPFDPEPEEATEGEPEAE